MPSGKFQPLSVCCMAVTASINKTAVYQLASSSYWVS